MLVHPFLRFLDKTNGPITKLVTNSYSTSNRTFFYSLANLNSEICKGYRSHDVLEFCGAGWSCDRQESQEKAIVEALERWAFISLLNDNSRDAGFQNDPTSNGFAAVPTGFGESAAFEHSLLEALERYALNCFWSSRSLPMMQLNSIDLAPDVSSLFDGFDGNLAQYRATLSFPENLNVFSTLRSVRLHFILSLFWFKDGGVIPGSACHTSLPVAAEKSALEAFNHLKAIKKIQSQQRVPSKTITDRRLVRFGTDQSAAAEVQSAIDQCLSFVGTVSFPQILFAKRLSGPWEPEVIVTRVVVADSPPITEGDECRFLI